MAKPEPEYIPVATDEPVMETGIDPFEVLWEKHKGAIIGGALAVVVLLAGGFGWMYVTSAQRAAAEQAFASATTADEYQAVIEGKAGTVVAGNAALLLAELQRKDGKLDEANATLRAFVTAQPEHAFVPLAQIALAENEALAGRTAEALTALQAVADTHSASFAAPVALLLKGDLALADGNRNEALRTYQRLTSQYSGTVAAESAAPNLEALLSIARPASQKAKEAPATEATEADSAVEGAEAAGGGVETSPTGQATVAPSPAAESETSAE